MKPLLGLTMMVLAAAAARADAAPRARDIGVPFEGVSGPLNAITDVDGVEVGHATLIGGSGKLIPGKGPVRTGVTAVLPRGRGSTTPVFAGWFTLNAAGEMTGTTWIEERGLLDGPIMITNTHSVGVVRDAAVKWMVAKGWKADWNVPVAAETWDGVLNDLNGFHVRESHALAALDAARAGPVAEGNVGGGTGMVCSRFKGGIGTSSRRLPAAQGGYTVGVLVQCNYGARNILRIAGAPVGAELKDRDLPCYTRTQAAPRFPFATCSAPAAARAEGTERRVPTARSSSWLRPMHRCCRTN
jgi:L-aminopeptidase/D-esterase-like protein